jgi:hypothetical protein
MAPLERIENFAPNRFGLVYQQPSSTPGLIVYALNVPANITCPAKQKTAARRPGSLEPRSLE